METINNIPKMTKRLQRKKKDIKENIIVQINIGSG